MPFYKKDGEQLLSGNWVAGPYDSFLLTEDNKDEHTYPVDGWYWFANLDAAMAGMPKQTASVTRAQAKLALLEAGLLDQVQPAIDAIPDPVQRTAAQIEWDDRLTFERTNYTLIVLSSMLGLTESQLDQLFLRAGSL